MSIPADYKALVFFGVVAVLGAGVRVTRAAGHARSPASTSASASSASPAAALDRQMQAADSSAKAGRAAAKRPKRSTSGRSSRAKPPARTGTPPGLVTPPAPPAPAAPRPKLDLDVATAAQIDSLRGVTPTMAKRIVADRLRRGPFLSLDGLRRVSGAGPRFLHAIDTLVTFSGTYAFPNWDDTVIPRRVRRARTPRPP